MKGDRFPTVIDLNPLPGEGAVLMLDDGVEVKVCGQDHPAISLLIPGFGYRLTTFKTGQAANATAYRVPHALVGRLAWALCCHPHFPPALLGIERSANTTTFTAAQSTGDLYTLTAPNDRLACSMDAFPGTSGSVFRLAVLEREDIHSTSEPSARDFLFNIYPEMSQGAACLATLAEMGVDAACVMCRAAPGSALVSRNDELYCPACAARAERLDAAERDLIVQVGPVLGAWAAKWFAEGLPMRELIGALESQSGMYLNEKYRNRYIRTHLHRLMRAPRAAREASHAAD